MHCLEADPAKRYPTAAELADELARFGRGEPVHARPVSAIERLWRHVLRRKAILIPKAVALLLGTALTVFSILAILARREREVAEMDVQDTLYDSLESARSYELAARKAEGLAAEKLFVQARDSYVRALAVDPGSLAASEGVARTEAALAPIRRSRLSEGETYREAYDLIEQARTILDQARQYSWGKDANQADVIRRTQKCQELLEQVIKKTPRVALAHHYLGKALRLRGLDEDAARAWLEALRIDPGIAVARFELRRLETRRKFIACSWLCDKDREMHEKLGASYEDWVVVSVPSQAGLTGKPDPSVDPLFADVWAVTQEYEHGQRDHGIELAARGVRKYGDAEGVEDFYWLAGVLSTSAEERREAVRLLDEAIARRPLLPILFYWRAFHRLQMGDAAGAIWDFDRALYLKPDFTAAYRGRAEARAAHGNLPEAIGDVNALIDCETRHVVDRKRQDGATWNGDVFAWSGSTWRAMEWIRRGTFHSAGQDTTGALADWVQAYCDLGLFDDALRLDPQSTRAREGIARPQCTRGDEFLQKAEEWTWSKPDPMTPGGLVHGDMNEARPFFQAAIEQYDAALKVAPSLSRAYVGRGNARRALGDYAGAMADYATAIAELKGHWSTCWTLRERSRLRRSQGDWDGALADLTEAIAIAALAPDGRIPATLSSELESLKKQRDSRK